MAPSKSRREAADGIEWEHERREAETMAELANRDEQSAKSAQAEHGKQSDASQDFDVIYIGGIPPLRQVWADIKTVIRQRRELRNGVADGIEWDSERREAETMAEPVGQSEQTTESAQPAQQKAGKRRLPPGKLDVIYTSGFPPFWRIWKSKGLMTIPPPRSSRER